MKPSKLPYQRIARAIVITDGVFHSVAFAVLGVISLLVGGYYIISDLLYSGITFVVMALFLFGLLSCYYILVPYQGVLTGEKNRLVFHLVCTVPLLVFQSLGAKTNAFLLQLEDRSVFLNDFASAWFAVGALITLVAFIPTLMVLASLNETDKTSQPPETSPVTTDPLAP